VEEVTQSGRDRVQFPWRGALVALLAAVVAFGVYLARTDFHVSPREDTKAAVVAARQFAAGHGMTTRVTVPSVLVFLARHGREKPPWPNALRSPLAAMSMGWLMRVTSEPMAVALSSGLFFVLSVPLIFLLGHRLGGTAAGALAACTYALSPAGLFFGSSGLNESGTIFALAGIVYLLSLPMSWPTVLGAGVIAGIGYLGRSTMTLWAPVMVCFILWRARDRGWPTALARAALFCAPLVIAVTWWGLQMQTLAGEFGYSGQSDIIIRMETGLYPGRSPALSLESWDKLEFIAQHKGLIARKYARLAEVIWPQFVTMGGMSLLVALFVAEAVVVLAQGKRVSIHWLVYALLTLQLLLVPLASFGHGGVSVNRYLDPFGPIAATLGAAFAIELLRRYGASMRLAVLPLGLIVAITAVPTLFDLAVGPYHQQALAQSREVADYLRSHGSPEQVVASTHYADVAWASGFYAVGLPITPEEFLRMDRELLAVDWVHIRHRGEHNRERTTAWEGIMSGEQQLPGFKLVKRFSDGGVLLRREVPR